MADGDGDGDLLMFLVRVGLSVVAVAAFVVPEPASSATGLAGLFAIWGIDWSGDGGS